VLIGTALVTSQSLSVCKVCRNDHAIGTLDRHLQFSRDRMGGIFVSPLGRYVVRGMGGARGPIDEKGPLCAILG